MPEQPIMSAPVLRRLAEAADGYRTGQPVWFVYSLESPADAYPVLELGQAEAVLAEHPGSTLYGPFVTPEDPSPSLPIASIRVEYTDGSYAEMAAEGTDAVFFSRAAREKFVYPYYARLLGPEQAAELKYLDESVDMERHFGLVAIGGRHMEPTRWIRPAIVDLHLPTP